jgi:RNA polymerase sigma-70 factor, ECF subfamily
MKDALGARETQALPVLVPPGPRFLLNSDLPAEDSQSSEVEAARNREALAEPSDEACALRAGEGDRRCAEALVKRHHEAVSRLLWRFVRTRADLDDLVQETFLRMLRGLPEWTPQQPFKHWLLRIATNTGRDYFRRQKVRKRWLAEPSETQEDNPFPEPLDPGADPSARAAANEVKLLLSRLPPDERTLLTLHYLEGWKLSQVAEHLGWTLLATKLRAWRARNRLRRLFDARDFL